MKSLLQKAALLLALATPAAAHDGVQITDPYARVLAGNGAVYFTIHNHESQGDVLVSASSPDAAMVHLMTSAADAEGVMRMTMVGGGFAIDAEGSHTLAGGHDHVMLMDVVPTVKNGETLTLVLHFERAGDVTLTVPVDNKRTSEPGMGPTAFDARATVAASHAAHASGMISGPAGPDETVIVATMKAMFDKPDAPLTVDPVVVVGDHAVASWAQGDTAGRALLARSHHGWDIVLCGGPDLRSADFLAAHGAGEAEMLSKMFNQAEDLLGAAAVSHYSSFEGVMMVSDPDHN